MTNEKLETWLGFAKFVLGTFTLGLVTTLVNNSFQTRELELREQEQVGQFLEHALQTDLGIRRQFAEYFSIVTRSDEMRELWEEYYAKVDAEYQVKETLRAQLEEQAASEDLGAREREMLGARIDELTRELRTAATAPLAPINPRVYFHIRRADQRSAAESVAQALVANTFIVPGIERLDTGPDATELRYFRAQERAEAQDIGDLLRQQGVDVAVRYVPGYETSTQLRQRHYELWFSDQPIDAG